MRHSDIYVMNSDGTGQINLTRAKAGVGGGVWSPNGKKIAFSARSAGERSLDIYVMNSDGTSQTRLIRATDTKNFEVDFESPAWSPDGEKIAFMRTTRVGFVNSSPSSAVPATGPSGLYVMKPDGTGLRKLSKEMPYAQSPLWSPEGKEIPFSGAGGTKYVVNVGGTLLRELMPNVQDHISSYSWSPNGRKWLSQQYITAGSSISM